MSDTDTNKEEELELKATTEETPVEEKPKAKKKTSKKKIEPKNDRKKEVAEYTSKLLQSLADSQGDPVEGEDPAKTKQRKLIVEAKELFDSLVK